MLTYLFYPLSNPDSPGIFAVGSLAGCLTMLQRYCFFSFSSKKWMFFSFCACDTVNKDYCNRMVVKIKCSEESPCSYNKKGVFLQRMR